MKSRDKINSNLSFILLISNGPNCLDQTSSLLPSHTDPTRDSLSPRRQTSCTRNFLFPEVTPTPHLLLPLRTPPSLSQEGRGRRATTPSQAARWHEQAMTALLPHP